LAAGSGPPRQWPVARKLHGDTDWQLSAVSNESVRLVATLIGRRRIEKQAQLIGRANACKWKPRIGGLLTAGLGGALNGKQV